VRIGLAFVVGVAPAILVLVAPAVAMADEVRGKVVDDVRHDGIAGALLAVDGATVETDRDGGFVIDAPAGAEAWVIAEGYAPRVVALTADARIALTPDPHGTEVIELVGAPPDPASPTTYALDRAQIRSLPGTGNDTLRALQSLPGVGRMAFGIGGLQLRGAAPQESLVVIDGVDVPLAFHFGGVSSVFPSSMLDTVVLTPGGSDVAFGRGAGGLVELRSRAPRGDRTRVGGELGVLDASAYGEAAVAGGAAMVGVRRSYADLFLDRLLPADRMVLPRYYDGQLRWDHALAGGTVSVLGFFSDDAMVSWGGSEFAQGFVRGAVRYRRAVGRTSWTVTPWLGWGRTDFRYVQDDSRGENQPGHLRMSRLPVGLRADVRRDTDWGHLAAGLDGSRARVTLVVLDEQQRDRAYASSMTDLGAWVEARWRIANGALTVKPGLRVDQLGKTSWRVIEPRLGVTHELTSWLTLRESMGLHHQGPGPVWFAAQKLFEDLDPDSTARREDYGPDRALHTSVGARVALPSGVVASVTGYHVFRYTPTNSDSGRPDRDNGAPFGLPGFLGPVLDNVVGTEFGIGTGSRRRTVGLEVAAQRRSERWLAWLSYALARTQAHYSGPSRDGWIDRGVDQRHNLNVVLSTHLGAWQLGARLRFTTGVPYTPRTACPSRCDEKMYVEGALNSERVDDFVSVDARLDRSWHRSWGVIAAFLDVQNVTNHLNTEGVDYDEGGAVPHPLHGLPVLPMIGVSFQPVD
jgi:TonB-dependent Receptor Plug Domain